MWNYSWEMRRGLKGRVSGSSTLVLWTADVCGIEMLRWGWEFELESQSLRMRM
jgi:hypothetical protein